MACVATAPTPASARMTPLPTENTLDWTAAPISPVSGSKPRIEKVPVSGTASTPRRAWGAEAQSGRSAMSAQASVTRLSGRSTAASCSSDPLATSRRTREESDDRGDPPIVGVLELRDVISTWQHDPLPIGRAQLREELARVVHRDARILLAEEHECRNLDAIRLQRVVLAVALEIDVNRVGFERLLDEGLDDDRRCDVRRDEVAFRVLNGVLSRCGSIG